MDYSQLINDYLENQLPREQEDYLFDLLHDNDGLRAELREFIHQEAAMKSDAMSLTPSPASTLSIFAQIGYPAPGSATATSAGLASGVRQWIGRYAQGLKSGVFCSVITAIVCLYLINPWLNEGRAARMAGTPNEQNAIARNAGGDGSEAGTSGMNRAATSLPAQSSVTENFKPAPPDETLTNRPLTNQPLSAGTDENGSHAPGLREVSGAIEQGSAFTRLERRAESFGRTERKLLYPAGQIQPGFATPSNQAPVSAQRNSSNRRLWSAEIEAPAAGSGIGLQVELRGNRDWAIPGAPIGLSQEPFFSHSSLGVGILIGGRNLLSLELRRENFFQEFEGVNVDGVDVRYRQYPSLLSLGVAARHYFSRPEEMLRPFAQLSLGANEAGGIGRAMLGLSLGLGRGYDMLLGIENSTLLFGHDGRTYSSSKLGLHYGLLFHL